MNPRPAWRWLPIAAIALGIAFRFFHADWKIYSFDETVTSLRSAGYTLADVSAVVEDGKRHELGDLERFQFAGAHATPANIVRSLRAEDPQHPPLYFFATAALQHVVAVDTLFMRRLPAMIFGVAAIAAAYWLALELFADTAAALVFAALVALSPFHEAYAQQAREYSLFTLATLVASALLLRALRFGGGWTWAYAVSVAAGFWTYPIFALIAAAHAGYLVFAKDDPPRRRIAAALAIALGVVIFLPWVAVLAHGRRTSEADTSYMRAALPAAVYAAKWFFNIGSVFFDLDYVSAAFAPVALVLLAIAAYCARILAVEARTRAIAFVALLGAVPSLAMLAYDLGLHHSYGVQSRYLTPAWLALELATAFGLSQLAREAGRRGAFGRTACAVFLGAGACSLAVASYASSWWLANTHRTIPAIAQALRSRPEALIAYVGDDDYLLELAALLPAATAFRLHPTLESAIRTAPERSFAIVRPSDLTTATAALGRVELPPVFPAPGDPLVARLRRPAAGGSRNTAAGDEVGLYALPRPRKGQARPPG